MDASKLINVFDDIEEYRSINQLVGSSYLKIGSVPDSSKAILISRLQKDQNRPILVICPSADSARELTQSLERYLSESNKAFHFPEAEILPFERLSIEAGTVHERLVALGSIYSATSNPPIIITSIMGLLQKTLDPEIYKHYAQVLDTGEKISYESMFLNWNNLGYSVDATVERMGSAAKRGGSIDIFSTAHEMPCRIDMWGDVIDKICTFDLLTQRSLDTHMPLKIYPAKEILPQLSNNQLINELISHLDFSQMDQLEIDRVHEELANLMAGIHTEHAAMYSGFFLQHTLLDHLPENTLIITNEFSEITELATQIETRLIQLRKLKESRSELPFNFPSVLCSWDDAKAHLKRFSSQISLSRYLYPDRETDSVNFPLSPAPSYYGAIEKMASDIKMGSLGKVVLSTRHAERLREILSENDIGISESESITGNVSYYNPILTDSTHSAGYVVEDLEKNQKILTLLTDTELFGTKKQFVSKPKRHSSKFRSTSIEELIHGEYVVHADHGIGKFIGTVIRSEESPKEYLVLEYAEKDRLYIPMEQLSRITPYSGGTDTPPNPTRLGTQEWTRTLARAKESTKKLAFDLLELYAQRESVKGFSHETDSTWQYEMEDAFPFIETPDQLTAIQDVKYDMQQPRPMDRLICGDVGYGKTEIALRAIFKSILSRKQAAILVPTTVLASQHHQTLSDRLAPFPVSVELLSRFKSPKEQQEILLKLKNGTIDVIVGTHRLVQKDIEFKNLGIVIIDEEHRFGVNHKEQLKSLREEVDVLTLSATPIPRTLHMALAGIRDISTIQTPPEERLPVRTFLAEKSNDLIKEAIQREIDRGGQVFYLHNRVQSIQFVASQIRLMLPHVKIAVAHGQMPENDLSTVMDEFAEGEADVLVCTTIIESGLDIPNVNTLIVENADKFGLAQLYQLRGRIGRRAQRSYAYLMVEHGKTLTNTAQKRLETILAANELGAGFKIAMKDLEIRGAGNLLGADQSGHVHAIGFEMYSKLLAEAVEELRSQNNETASVKHSRSEAIIDLELTASIPEAFIEDMPTRMRMYQKLANVRDKKDITNLQDEIAERFGRKLPDEMHNLIFSTRVKYLAEIANVQSIHQKHNEIQIRMNEEIAGARYALATCLGANVHVGNQFITIRTDKDTDPWGKKLIETLENLYSFQEKLYSLNEEITNFQNPKTLKSD